MINTLFLLFITNLMFTFENPANSIVIYVNEILALAGLYYFLIKNYRSQDKQISVNKYVRFLVIYGFFLAIISWFFLKDGNTYQFFRTLTIWYSMFCFFLGIEFAKKWQKYDLNKKQNIYTKFSLILGIISLSNISMNNAPLFSMTLYQKKYFFALILIFVIAINGVMLYRDFPQSSTVNIIIVCSLLIMGLYKSKFLQKIGKTILKFKYLIFFIMLTLLSIFLYFANQLLTMFNIYGYNAFYLLTTDNSTIWRLILWIVGILHVIKTNILTGIGFGTKLFDFNEATKFISNIEMNNTDINYTIGTHNSYIYLFIRMGLLGMIPLLLIFKKIFRDILYYKLYNIKIIKGFMIAFIFISINAAFNVVLETPLYANTFWVILGMLYYFIEEKKKLVQENSKAQV